MRRSRTKKLSKAKADKNCSEYIRKRDADENGFVRCCTCGRMDHWRNMDAGHCISRRFETTRYDEQNIAAQCRYCNRFNQGEQQYFVSFIERRWGDGTFEKLRHKSLMPASPRNQYDYEIIAEEFKEKSKKL